MKTKYKIIDGKRKVRPWVLTVDLIFIVGTVLALLFVVGYARPLVIAPIDDLQTSNTSVLFEFEKGQAILLDDNREFNSPEKIYAEDNLVINFEPGKYYWKIDGVLDSRVRELTIVSEIQLKVRDKDGENYELVNAGNTQLDVEVYYNQTKIKDVVLDVDESKSTEGDKFIGGQSG